MVVTSYGRNKNRDDEIKKNQEKANNSPSYRCVAINKQERTRHIELNLTENRLPKTPYIETFSSRQFSSKPKEIR